MDNCQMFCPGNESLMFQERICLKQLPLFSAIFCIAVSFGTTRSSPQRKYHKYLYFLLFVLLLLFYFFSDG